MIKSISQRQMLCIILTIGFLICVGISISYFINYTIVEGVLQTERAEMHETSNKMVEKMYKHIYTYTYDDEQITAITLDTKKINANEGEKIKVVYNVKKPTHSFPIEEYYYKITRLGMIDIILLYLVLWLFGAELYNKWVVKRVGV